MAAQLAEARTRHVPQPQPATANVPANFDLDFFHAAQARDDQLVAQRAAHGVAGKAFVYRLTISGQQQDGISVDGAHQLACIYGGIQHRIVGTVEKKGPIFIFTSYPDETRPMSVAVSVVPELAQDDDVYKCLVEVHDVKTGNKYQFEKSENRMEQRRDGTLYERPNFQIICQSKARRNALLSVIPLDVQETFKARCLAAGQTIDIGSDVFRVKREAVVKFAAGKGIGIDRQAIGQLTLEQIAGLGEAARSEDVEAFHDALAGLGMASASEDQSFAGQPTSDTQSPAAGESHAESPKRRGRPPGSSNRPKPPTAMDHAGQPPEGETTDQDTGEVMQPDQTKPQQPFEE